jgi:hypothetical protein
MPPEAKVLIFYALGLAVISVALCWLDLRLHQRERE